MIQRKLKHDLIKSFSLPGLIKDFPVGNILSAKVTSSAYFFLWDERLYHDLYFYYIFIDLGNDQQSDGIHGNPRETELLWSCSDMYFASKTYHLQKVLPINRSQSQPFVSSSNDKERCVRRKNGFMGHQFPRTSADYCVVTKGASTQRN